MLDISASFVTKYCTVYLVTCAAVLSFLFRKRDDSGLIFLLCFTMIFNTILKECFGMIGPFAKSPTDYAFTSGHMNFDGVFFIWMALYSRYNFAKVIYVVIAVFFGWCMVYKGFHYAGDVIAAPFFSALSVYCYLRFVNKLPRGDKNFVVSVVILCFSLLTFLIRGAVESHILMAYSFAIGFMVPDLIAERQQPARNYIAFIVMLVFPIVSVFCGCKDVTESLLLVLKFFTIALLVKSLKIFRKN